MLKTEPLGCSNIRGFDKYLQLSIFDGAHQVSLGRLRQDLRWIQGEYYDAKPAL